MTAIGVAQSFYNTRAVFNPNEDIASTSNYNIANRVVGLLTHRFNLIKKSPTTLSAPRTGYASRMKKPVAMPASAPTAWKPKAPSTSAPRRRVFVLSEMTRCAVG